MNEAAVQELYKKYAKRNLTNGKKPHNADWMIVEDCHEMLREDCKHLQITKQMVRQAFSLSKMTVVNEID